MPGLCLACLTCMRTCRMREDQRICANTSSLSFRVRQKDSLPRSCWTRLRRRALAWLTPSSYMFCSAGHAMLRDRPAASSMFVLDS